MVTDPKWQITANLVFLYYYSQGKNTTSNAGNMKLSILTIPAPIFLKLRDKLWAEVCKNLGLPVLQRVEVLQSSISCLLQRMEQSCLWLLGEEKGSACKPWIQPAHTVGLILVLSALTQCVLFLQLLEINRKAKKISAGKNTNQLGKKTLLSSVLMAISNNSEYSMSYEKHCYDSQSYKN